MFFRSRSQKKRSKIRSKRDLAFRVKSDLRSDQKVIVRSLIDLSDQDRHYYDFRFISFSSLEFLPYFNFYYIRFSELQDLVNNRDVTDSKVN